MASEPSTGASAGAPGLSRVLGLLEVTAGGVGIIIGAGIYVLIGEATATAGGGVWMAFALAALLSVLTALSYVELASMFPSAAAEYEYARHAFPPWVAFLVGWGMILGLMVAAAAIALGFARYLGLFLPLDARLGAAGLICLVSVIAASGVKRSARLTLLLSCVQVGGLLLVAAIGIPHLGQYDLLAVTSAQGVVSAAALVFFAFIGFDEVITLAEETHDPTRTVPLALLLALGVSTVLYMAVAVAGVSVLGADALGASHRPLADVVGHVFGDANGGLMAVLAMVATTNTTLLVVTAASRLVYGMAVQGSLPAGLAQVSAKRHTPVAAIAVVAIVAIAATTLGNLAVVASVTDFAVYIVFLVVNATVVVLRLRPPAGHTARFRMPGAIGRVPVLPVLGLVAVLIMLSQLNPTALVIGSAVFGAGAVVALVVSPKRVVDPRTGH